MLLKGCQLMHKQKIRTQEQLHLQFSKQSVDGIINAEIKRMLEPVGLIQDIEGQIEYAIEGNEVQGHYDRMFMALDNVEQRTAKDQRYANE